MLIYMFFSFISGLFLYFMNSPKTIWPSSSRARMVLVSWSTWLTLLGTWTSLQRSLLPFASLTVPWLLWTVSLVRFSAALWSWSICWVSLKTRITNSPVFVRRVCADRDRAASGHCWEDQACPDDEQDGPSAAGAAAGSRRAVPDLPAHCGKRQRHYLHVWRRRKWPHGKYHGKWKAGNAELKIICSSEWEQLWLLTGSSLSQREKWGQNNAGHHTAQACAALKLLLALLPCLLLVKGKLSK